MPTYTPGSDEWWFTRLGKALADDEARLHEISLWAKGAPPLPVDLPDLAKPHYRRLLEIGRVHLADLPVTALGRRLNPRSFRTAAPGDEDGDVVAEAMWARCDFPQLKRWAITYGRSYTRTEKVDGEVFITAESPRQTITEADPMRPGQAQAALKVYRDAVNDRDVAVLDMPGRQRVAYRAGTSRSLPGQGRRWSLTISQWDLQEPTSTGLERCAVVEFDMEDGIGRFERHLPTLRRINHGIVQRMVLIALQAFRQRALKGAPKNDPDTGEEIDYDKIFSADPGSIWQLPQAVELWESGTLDFSPVLNAVKDDIKMFAVGTGTPVHIVQPDAANGSAEGAALLREGLIFDAEDVIERWKPRVAQTLAGAFTLAGDDVRGDVAQVQSLWQPPARESLTARASAAVQLKAAGVPWRARMEIALQASPSQIREWSQARSEDVFLDGDNLDDAPADDPPAAGAAA